MSRQTDAKARQGYNLKPIMPVCSTCRYYTSRMVREGTSPGSVWEREDGFVVLTILAAQCGHKIESCIGKIINSDPPTSPIDVLIALGDLASVIARGKRDKVMPALTNVANVLYWTARGSDIHITDCVEHAWAEIKGRKGRMIDGVFVKEGD